MEIEVPVNVMFQSSNQRLPTCTYSVFHQSMLSRSHERSLFDAMITTSTHSLKKLLTIGAVADRAGVSVETIRFYVRKGLIEQPKRPLGGVRTYRSTMMNSSIEM